MNIYPLGELAAVVEGLKDPAAVAAVLNDHLPGGLVEAVPAYATLGLYYSEPIDLDVIRRDIEAVQTGPGGMGKTVDIPCVYDGEDLAEVAKRLGLQPEEVVRRHAEREYRCYAVGFTPGFAYLGYLDDGLVLPRRDEPRVRVPAGSVAIAGRQTAVYPSESPGGWWLIGHTDLKLIDAEAGYFAIEVGDAVRFTPRSRIA